MPHSKLWRCSIVYFFQLISFFMPKPVYRSMVFSRCSTAFTPQQGSLPRRFRRQRIVIVGCGDVGARMLQLLHALPQRNIVVLSRNPKHAAALRQQGLRVLQGDLDKRSSLYRFAGLAHRIIHLAPPAAFASTAVCDTRSRNLIQALRTRSAPQQLVYVSTTGVYGNHAGAWVTESSPKQPRSARAWRRVDAERQLRQWVQSNGGKNAPCIAIVRAAGIYASARWVASMQQRLRNQRAVLQANEDIYTNRIHIDDLARACWLALWRGATARAYHANDDTPLKMADFYDLAAATYQLPPPPRISYAQACMQLPSSTLSFMRESRRLCNQRIKCELRLRLHYPNPKLGLQRTIHTIDTTT